MTAILDSVFLKLCQPKETVVEDVLQRELIAKKNGITILVHFLLFVILLTYSILLGAIYNTVILFNIAFHLLCSIVAFAICRAKPFLFGYLSWILMALYSPIMKLAFGQSTIFSLLYTSQIFPGIALFSNDQSSSFLLLSAIQLCYIYFFGFDDFMSNINILKKEQLGARIIYVFVLCVILKAMILIGLEYNFKCYQDKIIKSKKAEVSRQRAFILGFSHELRNLMNSMIGSIHISLSEVIQKVQPNLFERLKNAKSSGSMLLQLINNILDMGKLEINELEINENDFNICELLSGVWSMCSLMIREKRLKGSLIIGKNVPNILHSDQYRVTQIIYNIISNATKFTQRGYIYVYVDWLSGQSEINDATFGKDPLDDDGVFDKEQCFKKINKNFKLYASENNLKQTQPSEASEFPEQGILKILIKDTGIGIDEKSLKTLFQKFNSDIREASRLGTGFGLYITKELCKKLKGKIKAYSKFGEGTCFSICIPARSVVEEPVRIIEPQPDIIRVKRALIVDDVEMCRTVLFNYFNNFKIEIAGHATDGNEAFNEYLRLYRMKKPATIITMDVDMPNCDGKTCAEKIREFEERENIEGATIIIVSGNCTDSEIKNCLNPKGKIRAQAFLKKPVLIDELRNVLKKYE